VSDDNNGRVDGILAAKQVVVAGDLLFRSGHDKYCLLSYKKVRMRHFEDTTLPEAEHIDTGVSSEAAFPQGFSDEHGITHHRFGNNEIPESPYWMR
jgi:hypothetical protein